MQRIKRPNVATILVAVLAILLLGGGTATAAKLVTGKQIKNGSITLSDLSGSTKDALRGQRGPAGLPGAPGPAGAPGASGITEIVSAQANGTGTAFAACPSGTRPVSGGGIEMGTGYLWANGAARDTATGRSGWIVAGDDASPVTAFAYCSAGVSRFTFPDGTSAQMITVAKVEAAVRRRAAAEE